ncbi:MAG: arginine--tRNA ligase [Selenomonadaceae bacterium]|nr:arginine--tRNA ligase [Selenomonadaceae bacterium]
METKEKIIGAIKIAVDKAVEEGLLPGAELPEIQLEVPPEKSMGDFATNIAMQSARVMRQNPRKIAEIIAKNLEGDWLEKTDVAGPGFLNIYLKSNVLFDSFQAIYEKGDEFGKLPPKNAGKIQVEYVSANPTGPLHVGHGRGAAFGSALVNLLRAAGYDVESEYYINDAGNQMDNLAKSVNARYLELFGKDVTFPEDGYHGADIVDTAKRIKEQDGDKYLTLSEDERLEIFKDLAYKEKLAVLKEDLEDFQVTFNVWFSEKTLHPNAVNAAAADLKAKGKAYDKDGALWLKSTEYGDDKDRVIFRDNGVPTYLAADIAYHKNKFERGFSKVINIWGADHHGYICRVKAAMTALGFDAKNLEILLMQMVSLYRGGELVKMSKRTGESITLRELMEEVGVDAARYFFLMRSADSQLDFDLDLAKKESSENPVYYVQYAHARISSILRNAPDAGLKLLDKPNFSLLKEEEEQDLIKKIASFEEEIDKAAFEYAPQRIAKYAYDLASVFHSFYNHSRIVGVGEELGNARLALAATTARVIRLALKILGVSAPEKM